MGSLPHNKTKLLAHSVPSVRLDDLLRIMDSGFIDCPIADKTAQKLRIISESCQQTLCADALLGLLPFLAKAVARPLPKIELSEELNRQEDRRLVNWLFTFPGGESDLLSADGLLRTAPSYSFDKATGQPELRYLDAELVPKALERMRTWLAENDEQPTRLLKLLAAHALFLAIHPLADGNGRASRFLIKTGLAHISLWHQPLPLAFLIYRDRKHYVELMRRLALLNEPQQYFSYMLRLIGAAAELYVINEVF